MIFFTLIFVSLHYFRKYSLGPIIAEQKTNCIANISHIQFIALFVIFFHHSYVIQSTDKARFFLYFFFPSIQSLFLCSRVASVKNSFNNWTNLTIDWHQLNRGEFNDHINWWCKIKKNKKNWKLDHRHGKKE